MEAATTTAAALAPLPSEKAATRALPFSRAQITATAALLVIACALPFFLSNYRTFQASMVLIYAIALLGLNILTGFNGQISLGHGAFFAIGAYVTAILMDKFGVPYWACLPLAGAVCLLAGFLFGLPALRLEGIYLALATFALGVALPQLLKYKHFEAMDRRRPGHRADQTRPAVFLAVRAEAQPGPLVLLRHAVRHDRDVRAGLEPAARAGGPGPGGDPRPSDRRLDHGHQQLPVQVARLRRERHVHRHRGRARRHRRGLRRAGQLHDFPVHHL